MTAHTEMFRPWAELTNKRPFNMGRVYYVDNGLSGMSDSNEGTDPNHPLQTLQQGIDNCVDDQGDYVMVLDCYNADTPPILLNCATAHVIGMSLPTSRGWNVLDETTDLITLSGAFTELAGFFMSTTANDIIHVSTQAGGYCWIHHNGFGCAHGTTVNAIEFDGTGAFTNSLVEDCFFGLSQSTLSGYGIKGNGIQYTVRNCVFKQIGTAAIYITGTYGGGGNIYNNIFFAQIGSAESAGWAIYLYGVGTEGWMICNNWAAQTATTQGNNPYKDTSTGNATTNKNGWACNYDGSALVAAPDYS